MTVSRNANLLTFNGSGITRVSGTLVVTDNPQLPSCQVSQFHAALLTPQPQLTNTGNSAACPQ
jgi:hypothetical protein